MTELLISIPPVVYVAAGFFIINLVYVVLNTTKTIMTIKSTPLITAIMSGVTYGYYNVVLNQVASVDLSITIPCTIITNIIGVIISMRVMEKVRKDVLWKIEVTSKEELTELFAANRFSFAEVVHNERYIYALYAATRKETANIKKVLANLDGVKYCAVETKTL